MKDNLWILTEERPKKEVLGQIFTKFSTDRGSACFIDTVRILPILENGTFTFTYEVTGLKSKLVDKVYIKTVSGHSSFVDFLIFAQPHEPTQNDTPIYAIEETKTDDSESRNTGVYQRCSKFVFIQNYYPEARKIMLYNLQIKQKEEPTQTNIFGTRLLLTLGVEILGKKIDTEIFTPFTSIDDLIAFKSAMSQPPKGNVPINIKKSFGKIQISGRLIKADSLSHDPNIGALSIISAVLRKLGWDGEIEITRHGLDAKHVVVKENRRPNKFLQIANTVGIGIEGHQVPEAKSNEEYWKYDTDGEKLGTIFIHLVVENFTKGYSIFENHAGSEKGYFIPLVGDPIPLAKYRDREKYKSGDKDQIIQIPDLILIDFDRNEVINIEGKKYQFRQNGIDELANYDFIEENYINVHYPKFKIIRTVVLYGGDTEKLVEIEVGFLLNSNGKLVLGIRAPELFKEAIKNLLDFWK